MFHDVGEIKTATSEKVCCEIVNKGSFQSFAAIDTNDSSGPGVPSGPLFTTRNPGGMQTFTADRRQLRKFGKSGP